MEISLHFRDKTNDILPLVCSLQDPVLPTEDMVKVRIEEKTVAVVREKKKKKREVWIRERSSRSSSFA